jgi:hypothetical protein
LALVRQKQVELQTLLPASVLRVDHRRFDQMLQTVVLPRTVEMPALLYSEAAQMMQAPLQHLGPDPFHEPCHLPVSAHPVCHGPARRGLDSYQSQTCLPASRL